MKIDVAGLPEVQKIAEKYEGIATRLRDLSPIAEDLASIVRRDMVRRFDSSPITDVGGIVYGGVAWNRLTDYTLRRHPHRIGGQILIDTGEMRRDCISDSSNGNRYYTQVPGFFTYILTNKKARENQEKRPILFVHEELLNELSEAAIQFAVEEVR